MNLRYTATAKKP